MLERLNDCITARLTAHERAFVVKFGYENHLSVGGGIRRLIDNEMERAAASEGFEMIKKSNCLVVTRQQRQGVNLSKKGTTACDLSISVPEKRRS